MTSRFRVFAIMILLMASIMTPVAAEVTDQQVRDAIRSGVRFLQKEQNPDLGNWPGYPGEPGGLSALCTLALLNAGVDRDSPSIQKALNYLRSLGNPRRTYSAALITMALCASEPTRDRVLIRKYVNWFEAGQIDTGDFTKGSWGYSPRQQPGDNSNTQFAMLALNEAERVGIAVSQRTWRLAQQHWEKTQKADGSWCYRMTTTDATPSSGSMTCAGIASMVIASGRLSSGRARVLRDRIYCCGDSTESDSVQRGLQWLGRAFTVRTNPGIRSWLLYYLYGIERVGRLTGNRFIGRHDWYREGAEMLIRRQDLTGGWRGVGVAEENSLVATSLALLFLSKGRRPVVIAKAKYGNNDRWDLHSGGVPNLTRNIEMAWRRDLTWQTIDLKAATVQDMMETPVLFLSGSDALRLTRDEEDTLRAYISQGGFLFAEACEGDGCHGLAFDRTFRALMKRLFPESQLRLLPPDHPVWFADGKVNPAYLRPLYGIEACCRTSVVYCPRNLACLWDLDVPGRESPYVKRVQDEIDASIQIGRNVVAYATNRNLKEKLVKPNLTFQDAPATATERGVLIVPKLSHSGGADDAPNALSNLMRFVHQKLQLRALSEHRLLPPESESLFEYPILFTHGRRAFSWSAAQRKAIADYIHNGGFLFADAICASPQFATAFHDELTAIFPGQKFVRIPANHPLFTAEYGGFDLTQVTLNNPQARQEGEPLEARREPVAPLLEGLQVDGRLAVIFSPYDISCALESNASLECKGYIKTDAARIGANIILFALEQ